MDDQANENSSSAANPLTINDGGSGKSISRKIKLLLVDDEPDVISSFKIGLEAYGYIVDAFTGPELALVNFRPETYHVLLLDINMPKMDGFKLFQQIEKKDPKARVFFVTAYETYFEAFKEIFPDLDIGSFVRKPISIEKLAKQIESKLLEARPPK
jgi:two-component system catabolic regulation response regulator CreB/two-component system response regulator ChvI